MRAVMRVYAVVRVTRQHTQVVNLYIDESDAQTEAERYNGIMTRGSRYTATPMTVYQSAVSEENTPSQRVLDVVEEYERMVGDSLNGQDIREMCSRIRGVLEGK